MVLTNSILNDDTEINILTNFIKFIHARPDELQIELVADDCIKQLNEYNDTHNSSKTPFLTHIIENIENDIEQRLDDIEFN